MLSVELQNAGFKTKIAEEDADLLIVETAATLNSVNNISIVGEDVDSHYKEDLFFKKRKRSRSRSMVFQRQL